MKTHTLRAVQKILGISRPILDSERKIARAAGHDMTPKEAWNPETKRWVKGFSDAQIRILKAQRAKVEKK